MNLGSRFRINLNNLIIFKVFFFFGLKKIEEKESRGRERIKRERREKQQLKKLNRKLQ